MSIDIQVNDSVQKPEVNYTKMSSTNPSSIELKSLTSYELFPPYVKRRVKALKKLQFEKSKIDGEFEKEVFNLRIKFAAKYAPLLDKRSDIISGKHEPNDNECNFTLDEDEELSEELKRKLNIGEKKETKVFKGIPGFWLLAMKNDQQIEDWIEPHDEPVLLHLMDIKVIRSNSPPKVTLKFLFSPNDYFTNSELTKEYELVFGPDPKYPWDVQKYVAFKRKGCAIDWKKDKNVTQKTRKVKIPKKENQPSGEVVETLSSFFDLFDPLKVPDKAENIDDRTIDRLVMDWRLAKILYSSFIRNAVLYLTGDIFDDYDEEDESSESDSSSSASSSPSSPGSASSKSSTDSSKSAFKMVEKKNN